MSMSLCPVPSIIFKDSKVSLPKNLAAANTHTPTTTTLLETGGDSVSKYFLPMTVTRKAPMRVVKSPGTESERCACGMSMPQALVICSL